MVGRVKPPSSLKISLPHSLEIMKKISTMEIIMLVLFVAWAASIDMNSVTLLQKVGLGAVFAYGVLLVVKVVRK